MANQPLDLLAFPISQKKKKAAGGTKTYTGHFTCRRSTARFLDIEDRALVGAQIILVKRKAHTRNLTLADGTVLSAGGLPDGGGGEVAVAESQIVLPMSMDGSQTIRLITGKQTARKNFQEISFRFPGFATIKGIADALGSLIPNAKVKSAPTATDIKPFFITEGGRRYFFMEPGAATAQDDTKILTIDPPENAELIAAAPEG